MFNVGRMLFFGLVSGRLAYKELEQLANNLNLDESDLEDGLVAEGSDGGWDDLDEPQIASTRQIGVNEDERSLGVENSDLEARSLPTLVITRKKIP